MGSDARRTRLLTVMRHFVAKGLQFFERHKVKHFDLESAFFIVIVKSENFSGKFNQISRNSTYARSTTGLSW